jgi:hypothetical protein
MRKFTNLVVLLLLTFNFQLSTVQAQSPKMFKYQTVVRNSAGLIVQNQAVAFKISILQGSATTGTVVYSETHHKTTNDFGLVNLEIGSGTNASGTINAINWANGPYFVKVELDINNGTTFITMGTSELLSVPYALYAEKAGTTTYTETDPIFAAHPSHGITATNITNWTNAFGWGNHSSLYRPVSWVPAWSEITAKPTTIAGYGITDAISNTHIVNGITASNITNWNAAFGWGNHTGLYRPVSWVPAWSDINSKPTTLAGYGITDAFNGTWASLTGKPALWDSSWATIKNKPAFATVATSGNYNDLSNKPTLFSGNFADLTNLPTTLAGHGITNAMSTSHAANAITATNITNWTTAFGWGNHAGLYRPVSYVPAWSEVTSKPSFATVATTGSYNDLSNKPTLFSGSFTDMSNKPTTLAGYGITDAMSILHAANSVSAASITNWNAAFGWGNHAGLYRPISYVPAWTEVTSKPTFATVATSGNYNDLSNKPSFNGTWASITGTPTTLAGYGITNAMSTSHAANAITATNITNWTTAFGWGNHAGLYRPITYVPAWSEITSKPNFATVATTGSYNDLTNKPAPYVAGSGIQFTGSTISTNISMQVSATGDVLTLTPGNSVYIPGISAANTSNPIVTTKPVSNITATKAYGSGKVQSFGTTAVTETGMCWSINQPPTISDNYVASGVYDGDFICIMNGLTANTIYFARAYAKVGALTYYGETVIFTSADILPIPTLTTTEVSGITETTALSGGYISANGGSAVTERGVCWSTSPSPLITNSKTTNGSGNGLFTGYITGLTLNTQYYVRAYATNANGSNYGPELLFKTAGVIPTVTTAVPLGVTEISAITGGNVTATGSTSVSERGVCYSTSLNPTINDFKVTSGSGTGIFSLSLIKLTPNTTYYARAYATNSVGTSYGLNQTFTTLNAYYAGFETTMPTGWSGMWYIATGKAFDGYYSLYTEHTNDTITFTRTVSNPVGGQISFYYIASQYSCVWYYGGYNTSYSSNRTEFYIDNVLQATFAETGWSVHSFPLTTGTHTFKWKNIGRDAVQGNCWGVGTDGSAWIDYIIMTQ